MTRSPLHAGLPTDRLVAEWWLGSDRVKNVLVDQPPPIQAVERISIPSDVTEVKSRDSAAGARIQNEARARFESAMSRGLVATSIERRGDVVDYILETVNAIVGLALPELPPEAARVGASH